MGEARQRLVRMAANGQVLNLAKTKRVRVVSSLKLENRDGFCYLILGDDTPELAMELSVSNSRLLAEELTKHADALEKDNPKIILPGGLPDGA